MLCQLSYASTRAPDRIDRKLNGWKRDEILSHSLKYNTVAMLNLSEPAVRDCLETEGQAAFNGA